MGTCVHSESFGSHRSRFIARPAAHVGPAFGHVELFTRLKPVKPRRCTARPNMTVFGGPAYGRDDDATYPDDYLSGIAGHFELDEVEVFEMS